MDLFEDNLPLVFQALENGDFDYMESASEVCETDFFKFINAKTILPKLAETYPTPRKKQEVPLMFYVSANLSMRFHGVHAYNSFPMLVRIGGMLNAFGPQAGRKVVHPDTGEVTLSCEGFNKKNHYDRQTPCDQDFLRKMAKDTEAEGLMRWFGRDVVSIFRNQRAFDKEGIFIGDASYLFVPDNPNYEGSSMLLFDQHDHLISKQQFEQMPDEKKAHCNWRRCYKMVTLLHTNRSLDFFLFAAVKVISGKDNESPVLYKQVEEFVDEVGKGVMKRLILDRGFLNGKAISTCKKDYDVDILIPVRRNMDIYTDAMALFQLPDVHWVDVEEPEEKPLQILRPHPKSVIKRERKRQETLKKLKSKQAAPQPEKKILKRQAAAIGQFQSWSSCTVPLTVIANREFYAVGREETWLLLDTKEVDDPGKSRQEYHLRTAIEERYRQLKCFSDLTHFSSRAFSMIVNQVVFIMLACNLLQFYLLRLGKKQLNKKPLPYIRKQLIPSDNHIIVYWKNYYGLFRPFDLVGFVVQLKEKARKKIADKCRRIRCDLSETMKYPRPP